MDTRKVIDKNIKDRKVIGLDYINTNYQFTDEENMGVDWWFVKRRMDKK